jgi:hypothetical protein
MHTLEAYAEHCGIKPSEPTILELFYPIPLDKYFVFHTHSNISSPYHYDYWDLVWQVAKPLLNDMGFKIVQIQTGGDQVSTFSNFCDLKLNSLNFQQMSYVVKKSEGYIGSDDVLMHIASMYDKKILALFPDRYPQNAGPYWNNSSPVTSLSPDFSTKKPMFGRPGGTKRINEILPETIVKSLISLLKGFCNKKPMTSLSIGHNYHNKIVEVVPNFFSPALVAADQSVNIRADFHFDEGFILKWANSRRVNIFMSAGSDYKFLRRIAQNINQLNVFVDINTDPSWVKEVQKTGTNVLLLCKDTQKLDAIRLKLLDWTVDSFKLKTKKDIDNISDIDYTSTKFNSTKMVLSNNKKYPSIYHATHDEKTTSKLFDDDLFWGDVDNFYIFNI